MSADKAVSGNPEGASLFRYTVKPWRDHDQEDAGTEDRVDDMTQEAQPADSDSRVTDST